MKYLRNVLENFIKSAKMEKLEIIWAMFKKYLNNPTYLVKQEDVLASLFMNGEEDLRHFMNTLGIRKYNSKITYGQLLTLLNIM